MHLPNRTPIHVRIWNLRMREGSLYHSDPSANGFLLPREDRVTLRYSTTLYTRTRKE